MGTLSSSEFDKRSSQGDKERWIQEVQAAESTWVQAHLDLDLETIANLMAEDYQRIDDRGRLQTKETVLAAYQREYRHWDQAESDQLSVQIHGDLAILIGRWQARGENQGVAFDYAARFVSIYVHKQGRWKMLFEQSTPIS